MVKMGKLLSKNFEDKIYTYVDLLTLLGVRIETNIQDLKDIKGIQVDIYANELKLARNYLIKAQQKVSNVRARLKKDYWKDY